MSQKYNLKNHPNYKFTAEADKRNSFDIYSLINTKLKINPDDIYAVYQIDESDDPPAGVDNFDETIDRNIFNYDDLDDPDAFA